MNLPRAQAAAGMATQIDVLTAQKSVQDQDTAILAAQKNKGKCPQKSLPDARMGRRRPAGDPCSTGAGYVPY